MLCRAYYRTFKTPVVITHCSNNYGPYQYPEKLIPFLILRMLENKKLPIYGDGKNVRDWIYVLDHCEALRLCLLKGRLGEVYNIGADNEINNLQIADLILKYFNRGKEWIEFVFDRPGHDRRYAINDSKIKKNWAGNRDIILKKRFQRQLSGIWTTKNGLMMSAAKPACLIPILSCGKVIKT